MKNSANFIAPEDATIIPNWRPFFGSDGVTHLEMVTENGLTVEFPAVRIDMENLVAYLKPGAVIRMPSDLEASTQQKVMSILGAGNTIPNKPTKVYLGKMDPVHYERLMGPFSGDLTRSISARVRPFLKEGWKKESIPPTIVDAQPQTTVSKHKPRKRLKKAS